MYKPTKAFILAAGMGTRLRPYTDHAPKPMVTINGKSIIERNIEKLVAVGVQDIVVNLHYLAPILKAHLNNISSANIIFSEEEELLNTGGGIKKALHHFGHDPFYIINGDALWDDDETPILLNLAKQWDDNKMDMLLLLEPQDLMISGFVGDYDLKKDKTPVRNKNKIGNYMFAGIRIASSRIFKDTPDGAFSFLDLMDKAQDNERLHAVIHTAPWYHISTPKDLEEVDTLFKERAQ